MGDKSKIEWTDATWNPVTGCSKVSQGCKHCYAERQFPRIYSRDVVVDDGGPRPRKFTDVLCHSDRLDQPLRWLRPRMVFVNSMSDLFHEDVPHTFIIKVFIAMANAPQHTFQILTKRPERMREIIAGPWVNWNPWPLPNVWLGVSVEDQETANERLPLLLQTPAAVRWVSAEPLLGPVDFTRIPMGDLLRLNPLNGYHDYSEARDSFECIGDGTGVRSLHWVVVGGESGPKARPMHPDWARSIRDQCKQANVPFFFKQWGEWLPVEEEMITIGDVRGFNVTAHGGHFERVGKKRAGSLLDGVEHKEYPEVNHG